jgi:hypothetical protein
VSGLLNRFQVDARMAHTALENDAKKEMKEVSMSVLEEFANAIRTRNLRILYRNIRYTSYKYI